MHALYTFIYLQRTACSEYYWHRTFVGLLCTYIDGLHVYNIYMIVQGSIDKRIDMLCRRALGLDIDSILEVFNTNIHTVCCSCILHSKVAQLSILIIFTSLCTFLEGRPPYKE
jgi:hypothetical protein